MIIPKLVIISLGKQGQIGVCASLVTGPPQKRPRREARVQKTASPERAACSPLLIAGPRDSTQPSLIKWYFPHTKAASGLILSQLTPPSFFPAREHNERGPCLNPKVGYHSNLIIHADQSLFNANQDNRSAL